LLRIEYTVRKEHFTLARGGRLKNIDPPVTGGQKITRREANDEATNEGRRKGDGARMVLLLLYTKVVMVITELSVDLCPVPQPLRREGGLRRVYCSVGMPLHEKCCGLLAPTKHG
jgi:hypothetical protein